MNRRALLFVAAILLAGMMFSVFPKRTAHAPSVLATTSVAAAAEAAAASPSPATTTPRYTWYPVERVVDGDTFIALVGGTETRVRLIGIDTPETVDPRKPVQCFGPEASAEAHKLLDGKDVRFTYDAVAGEKDKYGRILAYAFLPDGTFYNEFMVREGYARQYDYDKQKYEYLNEFEAAEAQAKSERLGLWASVSLGGCATSS